MSRTSKKQSQHQAQSKGGIPIELIAGMTPEDAQEYERAWRNSTYVLDRLKGIIARKVSDLSVDKPDDYNNPSWSVVRADRNGELRALKSLLRLLP